MAFQCSPLYFYSLLTIFFLAFSRIYDFFSFGESSLHMHYLFVVPLVGGIILALLLKTIPNLGRLSLNLWNSAVAVLTAGTLFRGIVHLSVVQRHQINPTGMLAQLLLFWLQHRFSFRRGTVRNQFKNEETGC